MIFVKTIIFRVNTLNLIKRFVGSGLLLIGFAVPSANASLADTIDQIKPSIVGVGTLQKIRQPPAKLMGTGFAVANGRYIITNAHVIPDELDYEKNETLVVFIGSGRDSIIRTASLIKTDRRHDLALLKVSDFRLPAMKLGKMEQVREGELYAFTGFPIGAILGLYPVTHRGIVSAISPVAIPVSSTRQLDAAMIRRLRNTFDIIQLDATAYPGNSGSPLYDAETGVILGVINKVFIKETKEKVLEKPSGITYAIPVTHVRALLDSAGVEY